MKRTAIALGVAAALALPGTAMAKPAHAGQHGNSAAARADHVRDHRDHATHAEHRRDVAQRSTRYNGYACPPGLAKKSPRCVPPGQWRKGDRLTSGWDRQYIDYRSLPEYYRDRYAYNDSYRYMYRDNRVYVIDAVSRAVLDVVFR